MAFYNKLARFAKKLFSLYGRKWTVEYKTTIDRPAVYLVHHQNMFGPIHALCLLPEDLHMWSLHVFLDSKTCFDQFYGYTLTLRNKWPKAPAYVAAKVLSWVIPGVLKSFKAIPVHHNAAYITTIRKTMEVFKHQESILLCPDIDYTSQKPYIGEMYTGFLMVQKVYQERVNDKPLPFVPLYCSKKQKKIVVGEPMIFDSEDLIDNKEAIALVIRNAINKLGYECGDISKKTYEKITNRP